MLFICDTFFVAIKIDVYFVKDLESGSYGREANIFIILFLSTK